MRFFFMHLGTLIGIITYFQVLERGAYTSEAVRSAAVTAIVVHSVYMAIASWRGYRKQLDVGLWLMFALAALSAFAGMGSVVSLFQRYSPALLFVTLALTALIPLLLGRETFTYFYGRLNSPSWQQKMPLFHTINRLMTAFWTLIFAGAAALCLWEPTNPVYTALLPNLLVLLVGIPAQFWLPPLYLKIFPPELPTSTEALIMSMPFVFNPKAAGDTKADIQFRVSGEEPGDYYLRILRGRCESFEGVAESPVLTVHTPNAVWRRIAHGELDGGQALMDGLYRAEGDYQLLAKIPEIFKVR
jgi:SCP-2 sterol transfer family